MHDSSYPQIVTVLIGADGLCDRHEATGIRPAPLSHQSPMEGDGNTNGGMTMHWIMTALMMAGFGLAGMSGMVCFMGATTASHHLSGLQLGELCLASPYLCMTGGVTMLFVGLFGQQGRIQ